MELAKPRCDPHRGRIVARRCPGANMFPMALWQNDPSFLATRPWFIRKFTLWIASSACARSWICISVLAHVPPLVSGKEHEASDRRAREG
jgi:hypothetical protein